MACPRPSPDHIFENFRSYPHASVLVPLYRWFGHVPTKNAMAHFFQPRPPIGYLRHIHIPQSCMSSLGKSWLLVQAHSLGHRSDMLSGGMCWLGVNDLTDFGWSWRKQWQGIWHMSALYSRWNELSQGMCPQTGYGPKTNFPSETGGPR